MSDTTEFSKLMWLPDGREIAVRDQDEQDRQAAEGARLSVTAAASEPFGGATAPTDEEIVSYAGEDDAADKPKKRRGKK